MHLLLITSAIPSSLCLEQYKPLDSPDRLKEGLFLQFSCAQSEGIYEVFGIHQKFSFFWSSL